MDDIERAKVEELIDTTEALLTALRAANSWLSASVPIEVQSLISQAIAKAEHLKGRT